MILRNHLIFGLKGDETQSEQQMMAKKNSTSKGWQGESDPTFLLWDLKNGEKCKIFTLL